MPQSGRSARRVSLDQCIFCVVTQQLLLLTGVLTFQMKMRINAVNMCSKDICVVKILNEVIEDKSYKDKCIFYKIEDKLLKDRTTAGFQDSSTKLFRR